MSRSNGLQKLVSRSKDAEFIVDLKNAIKYQKRYTVFEIFTYLWDLVFLGHQCPLAVKGLTVLFW